MAQQKNFFCDHLAQWLHKSDWHFTTLLTTCINSVNHLPDRVDTLINELLLTYPQKPSRELIFIFLQNNTIVKNSFRQLRITPEIVTFNLHSSDRSQLINKNLPELHTVHDLAAWLDTPFSQLDWLADLLRHNDNLEPHLRHYAYYRYPKKGEGNRLIESPKRKLKTIQQKINTHIVSYMPVSNAAHAFRKKRSCRTNALLHTQKKHLLRFDIADCFQSIQWHSIYHLFKHLGYTNKIAKYLTGLCTHRCYITNNDVFNHINTNTVKKLKQRHLPQGAPSSPALSNAALIRLDNRLTGLAEKIDATYTRYADDLFFSSNNNKDWRSFIQLTGAICLEEGFELNYKKTQLLLPHQKQRVTGIVVNEKVNIDRNDYDKLKAILTNCIRHGARSQNRYSHNDFKNHLLGKIQYVKSINTVKGNKLALLFNQINWSS